jgi:hypothetical protein
VATAALLLNCWLEPPLQQYLPLGSVNWYVAIMDPQSKQVQAIPSGGALAFTWTQPPVVTSPQAVTPQLQNADGSYSVVLPITSAMYGKLLLEATLTDSSGAVVAERTLEAMCYPSGQ